MRIILSLLVLHTTFFTAPSKIIPESRVNFKNVAAYTTITVAPIAILMLIIYGLTGNSKDDSETGQASNILFTFKPKAADPVIAGDGKEESGAGPDGSGGAKGPEMFNKAQLDARRALPGGSRGAQGDAADASFEPGGEQLGLAFPDGHPDRHTSQFRANIGGRRANISTEHDSIQNEFRQLGKMIEGIYALCIGHRFNEASTEFKVVFDRYVVLRESIDQADLTDNFRQEILTMEERIKPIWRIIQGVQSSQRQMEGAVGTPPPPLPPPASTRGRDAAGESSSTASSKIEDIIKNAEAAWGRAVRENTVEEWGNAYHSLRAMNELGAYQFGSKSLYYSALQHCAQVHAGNTNNFALMQARRSLSQALDTEEFRGNKLLFDELTRVNSMQDIHDRASSSAGPSSFDTQVRSDTRSYPAKLSQGGQSPTAAGAAGQPVHGAQIQGPAQGLMSGAASAECEALWSGKTPEDETTRSRKPASPSTGAPVKRASISSEDAEVVPIPASGQSKLTNTDRKDSDKLGRARHMVAADEAIKDANSAWQNAKRQNTWESWRSAHDKLTKIQQATDLVPEIYQYYATLEHCAQGYLLQAGGNFNDALVAFK